MNQREFHNALRILRSIDFYEVPWMDREQWASFRDHPYGFCIRCSDADYDRIWAVIEARQARSAARQAAYAATRADDMHNPCPEDRL